VNIIKFWKSVIFQILVCAIYNVVLEYVDLYLTMEWADFTWDIRYFQSEKAVSYLLYPHYGNKANTKWGVLSLQGARKMLAAVPTLLLSALVSCGTAYLEPPLLEALAAPSTDHETTSYLLPRLSAKLRPHGEWYTAPDPRFYVLTEMESNQVTCFAGTTADGTSCRALYTIALMKFVCLITAKIQSFVLIAGVIGRLCFWKSKNED
jgi:hypothetical protein